MIFNDHFSQQSESYRQFRPRYPRQLFEFLADEASSRDSAWDCATGNGQAAVALSEFFERVVATDASQSQVDLAIEQPGVEYRVSRAEESGIDSSSMNVVTVANGVHWFDIPTFFAEAQRVLRPRGIIALWCYESFQIEEELLAGAFQKVYDQIDGCWQPNLVHVRSHYRELDFPFEEIACPAFEMAQEWSLDQCLGFISSWSAVQTYRAEKQEDPLATHYNEIAKAWGEPEKKRLLRWPLHMKVGRV